ncbi:hypothetical protein AYM39_04120 [Methylomonas sp. DH-1]|nr:hypothetical protein AYM39_04120 [Methylomonas sp. DH-1]
MVVMRCLFSYLLIPINTLAFQSAPIKMIGMAVIKYLNMTDSDALKILRECAADDGRVFFSRHAIDRMMERKITRPQVLSCLEKGKITESPCRDPKGDWRCTLEHYTAGSVVTVAVAIKHNNNGERTVIVTVF